MTYLRPASRLFAAFVLLVLAALAVQSPAIAVERTVPAEPGALARAVAEAAPGDVIVLAAGRHDGPITLDRPIILEGRRAAIVDGHGDGSVIVITGHDVTIRGLEIRGSGSSHQQIDSGVQIRAGARRARVEGNRLIENLVGVDVHGALDSVVRSNVIVGRQSSRMNDRGNGVYIWNAPGTVVEGNDVRFGRDGIFSNASKLGTYRNNVFRDLRFAVHYMYTHDSEVSGNVSIGNHLGYALMYSNGVKVIGNLSLRDRSHGLMLNYANNAEVRGNLVRGGTHEKCTFIYNAHKNLIVDNRFEGCAIGIHFTAGSERNTLSGNAFIGSRNQVKYVGTRHIEWSHEGRGNYWSDHPAFDLDGDGRADSPFRPNDLMDHILWSQPSAKLLLGSPAVQLIRWSQSAFPAIMPGGVVDSHPLMRPVTITVPERIELMERDARPDWAKRGNDDDADPIAGH